MAALRHGAFDERGLLDVVLHPQFPRNRRIFVTYSAPRRETAPADWGQHAPSCEFLLPAEGASRWIPLPEKILLEIDKPTPITTAAVLPSGGWVPLYWSGRRRKCMTKGGARSGNGQNLQTHLGKGATGGYNAPGRRKPYGIPIWTIRLPTDVKPSRRFTLMG